MPVLQLLAVYSIINMLRDIQAPDITEEHNLLIIFKLFVKKELYNSLNLILKNGVSMFKLFLDHQLTLPFTQDY
jgi:hypothetical protein